MLHHLPNPYLKAEYSPMKVLILLLLTFSVNSFAQMYRMSGDFTLFGNTSSPIRTNFTLAWSENGQNLEGSYSDNVLGANASVTGSRENGKRTFQVLFPTADPRHGVKSLFIETSDFQGLNANVSTKIISKDFNGAPLDSTFVFAGITPDAPGSIPPQGISNCAIGFGMLTGFCGLYSGNMNEQSDFADACELSGTRLELATSGELSLYFGLEGELKNSPRHSFGSVLGSSPNLNINKTVRHCGPLPATNLNSVGCKVLRFVGSFQDFGSLKNFSGTYDIRDEVTGTTCAYSLSLGREATY